MRTRISATIVGMALASVVATGCETSPPGGGFVNPPAPTTPPSEPAVRDDLPIVPDPVDPAAPPLDTDTAAPY